MYTILKRVKSSYKYEIPLNGSTRLVFPKMDGTTFSSTGAIERSKGVAVGIGSKKVLKIN